MVRYSMFIESGCWMFSSRFTEWKCCLSNPKTSYDWEPKFEFCPMDFIQSERSEIELFSVSFFWKEEKDLLEFKNCLKNKFLSSMRNIAEQSSEDRPPLVKITENIFQSQTNYILAHSGKAHHRELILIQTHYILARLTKRISPKTCFKATQIIFWRTHKRHITENKF